MAIELEGLEFQIEASSTKAEKKLKNLSDTLVRIRNAAKGGVGLGTVANQVSKVADAVNRVDTDKMQRLATICETIRGVRGPSGLARGFERMADAVNRIDVDRLERVRNALQGMNGIQLPRLNVPGQTATPAVNTSAASPVDSGVEEVTSEVEEAAASTSRLHGIMDSLRGVFTRTFTTGVGVLRTFGRAVTMVGNGIRMLGRVATVLPEKLGSGLAAKIKHSTSALGQFFASIKRIAMYRLIRSALKAITQGFSEGIKNLYHWSDALGGTFAKNMDKLATNAQYLKNSLGAMAAPLINALAPVIDFITDKLVDLMNFVNQLIAKLSGASTYTVAKKVATEWDDASKETKKATEEIKRYTLGFDELNILGKKDKDSDSSSKKETDYSSMFETKKVDSSISDITSKIQGMFAVFKQAWDQNGKPVIDAAKAALNSVKSVIFTVGDTFYKVFTGGYGFEWITSCLHVLQTVFDIVTAISDAFKTAWNDDSNGYQYIASIFSTLTLINELLASIGRSFVNAWNNGIGVKILSNILNIATGVNNVIGLLAGSITTAWNKAGLGEKIWNGLLTIVNTVLTAVNNMVTATVNWAADLNFEPILTAFSNLLDAINPVVEKVTGGLAWAYENILLPVGKWTIEAGLPVMLGLVSAAFGLLNTVLEALKPFAMFIWDKFLKPLGEWTGGAIVTVLGGITTALDTLSTALKKLPDVASEVWNNICTTVTSIWEDMKTGASRDFKFIKDSIVTAWNNVTTWTTTKWTTITTNVTKAWGDLKTSASEKFTKIGEHIADTWKDVTTKATTKWNVIKSNLKTTWGTISTNCQTTFETVSGNISSAWDSATTRLGGFVSWVRNTFSTTWDNAWNYVINLFGTAFNRMGELMKAPVNAVIDAMNWMIDKVETAINSVINGINSHLKIHIDPIYVFGNKVFGGLDWGAHLQTVSWGRIEELAVGGILNDPTLFGMLGNKPLMGGEAGREAVLPLETHTEWMDTLADKVRDGLPGADGDMTESVRQGVSEATARQNDLLREQNNLLRQILDKDFTAEVSFDDFTKAAQRKNRIYGTTVVPIG